MNKFNNPQIINKVMKKVNKSKTKLLIKLNNNNHIYMMNKNQ